MHPENIKRQMQPWMLIGQMQIKPEDGLSNHEHF